MTWCAKNRNSSRNRARLRREMRRSELQEVRSQHKYCSRDFPMKRLLLLLIFLVLFVARQAPAATAPANGEYVLLVGGPSLMMWEKYKLQPHDQWWAYFIRDRKSKRLNSSHRC